MTLTDEAAANLSASVAMLRDALEPLIEIVADRCSALSAEDWAALEDARQAVAQSDVRADAAPRWWTCRTHGPAQASSWGCPDCVREMRGQAQHLRAALQEADTLLGHDDNATEWRERWAGLWLNDGLGAVEPVADLRRQAAELERLQDVLMRIQQWADAYPLEQFPEVLRQDWQRANALLAEKGISMSAMSASNMRHVLSGVRAMVDEGLKA